MRLGLPKKLERQLSTTNAIYFGWTMLSDLEPTARQLAEYMSDLSEEAYAAGWMEALEFELWAALDEGPRDYGRLRISNDHIDKLRQLSAAAGGWIVFDDVKEESVLPLHEWRSRYQKWKEGTTS